MRMDFANLPIGLEIARRRMGLVADERLIFSEGDFG